MAKRLGVLGTMVWDTIIARDDLVGPTREWGGIAYALQALVVALPPEWEIVPIVKVGRDLSESALRLLRAGPRHDCESGVRVAAAENNRVELRYSDDGRRTERMRGGVPPWRWPELAPVVRDCDALYVNFISGFELELDTARALRHGFDGPIYADLHSLFLGIGRQGLRVPQELPSWDAWFRCFDAVQLNENEFDLLGRSVGDPWRLAAGVVGPELKLIAVTMGARGAAYVKSPAFEDDPRTWPRIRGRVGVPGATTSGRVPSEETVEGDPTGCGDVWGATLFASLLAGRSLEDGMRQANRAAGRNAGFRGARGLARHLAGELSLGREEI